MADTDSRTDPAPDAGEDPAETQTETGTDSDSAGSKAPANLAEALDVSAEPPGDEGTSQGVKA